MRPARLVTIAFLIALAACGRTSLKLQHSSQGGSAAIHHDAGFGGAGGFATGSGGQAGRLTGGAGGYTAGSGGFIGYGGARATGGTVGSGGVGGAPRAGGAVGSGGSATGGTPRTGGTMASGGRSGRGGSEAVGGSIRTGGSMSFGGSLSSGGTVGLGGAVAYGGTTGSGGASGTGGTCGNGVIDPGEQCDLGSENQDSPAFWVTQAGTSFAAVPLARDASVKDFYSYSSSSGHTGLEAVGTGRIFLYLEKSTHALSLVFLVGIDQDSSGEEQPESRVVIDFSGLPENASVAVSDDRDELWVTSTTAATGFWKFTNNTDGGALSGFPFPGSWETTLKPSFLDGVSTWTWVQSDGSLVNLDLGQPLTIKAGSMPSLCRASCTVPACGDGILDAGEICDEGPLPPDGDPGCHCMSFE
jgi:hypothetical protein